MTSAPEGPRAEAPDRVSRAAGVTAIILAGGRATRLGGLDKPRLDLDGTTALDRAMAAARGAGARCVVVGPEADEARSDAAGGANRGGDAGPATFVREDPPFGGPVAGVVRGLEEIRDGSDDVILLAGDLPFVTADVLVRLLAADADRVRSCVDDTGHLQFLCSVWPGQRLRAAVEGLTEGGSGAGLSMRRLFARPETGDVVEVDIDPSALRDIDTPEDVDAARARIRAERGDEVEAAVTRRQQ